MAEHMDVVGGVDTHADTHYAAVVTLTGERLAAAQFPATEAGYRALTQFIGCHGQVVRVGVEGTNSYGAGLTRHLRDTHLEVVEVIRPARQTRRRHGKSDEIDAYAAAHIALANNDCVTPKTSVGTVEALRVTLAARRGAIKARSEAICAIKSLLVTAPETIRSQYRGLATQVLVVKLAGCRARSGDDVVAAATRASLRRLAQRYQQLNAEIGSHDADLARLVADVNPAMVQTKGIGVISAAELLVTAGDNPSRIKSEGAFAMLCGAAPIPASSGKTDRFRLNRGGDRTANSALHHIAIARLASDPTTRAYAARRTADGKTKKDVLRCLKRAIAREVFHLITNPQPVETATDLRPLRHQAGLTLTAAAAELDVSTQKLSRLENGQIRDRDLLHTYRDWLTAQCATKNAA